MISIFIRKRTEYAIFSVDLISLGGFAAKKQKIALARFANYEWRGICLSKKCLGTDDYWKFVFVKYIVDERDQIKQV